MDFSFLVRAFNHVSGPVGHLCIPAALAYLCKLNILLAAICGILPDLIDKPLSVFSIGGGRFIGHTLLFAVIVIILFTIWKRKFGLAAFIGLATHLIIDIGALVPWFYPFKQYDFYKGGLDPGNWLKSYFTLNHVGYEIAVVAVIFVVLVGIWILRRYLHRKKKISDSPAK
jgi:hypothetical protein